MQVPNIRPNSQQEEGLILLTKFDQIKNRIIEIKPFKKAKSGFVEELLNLQHRVNKYEKNINRFKNNK